MMRRISIGLSVLLLFGAFGCVSQQSDNLEKTEDEQLAEFLQRPRFQKPVPRPLTRVLLSWRDIEGAKGYEVQMSDDMSFISMLKSWTLSGTELEIPFPGDTTVFFRVRAFDNESTSRWSEILKLKDNSL